MEITLLVKAVIGLVVVLGILVFILLLPKSKPKTKTRQKVSKKTSKVDLKSLRQIIRNRISSKKELQDALDLVIKHHGNIKENFGTSSSPHFDDYMEILIMICRHPNTDKNIILNFDKQLSKLNPEYKSEINDSISKGLNSRSV